MSEQSITIGEAQELFRPRNRFFGPEEIRRALGPILTPSPENVPTIPFSKSELDKAWELGQFLELCGPFSMAQIHGVLKNQLAGGKLLFNNDWYRRQGFYLEAKDNWHWRLTTLKALPTTLGVDFFGQMQALIKYLKDEVFAGQALPMKYTQAIEELERVKVKLGGPSAIQDWEVDDWEIFTSSLNNLRLNKLLLETPAQILWSFALFKTINDEYLLAEEEIHTNQSTPYGGFVAMGRSSFLGIHLTGHQLTMPHIGMRFSRRDLPPLS